MNRRKLLSFLPASLLGFFSKKRLGLFSEGCSYCGKAGQYDAGTVYSALEISKMKDGKVKEKRRICADCLIVVFDNALL